MSVHRARSRSASRGEPKLEDILVGEPPKEFVHGVTAYRSGKCKCATCRLAHNEKAREYAAAVKAGTHVKRVPAKIRIAQALPFLEDGATFREAAATVRTDHKTLARAYPQFNTNWQEWNSVLASIKNNPTLLALHREIWQSKEQT